MPSYELNKVLTYKEQYLFDYGAVKWYIQYPQLQGNRTVFIAKIQQPRAWDICFLILLNTQELTYVLDQFFLWYKVVHVMCMWVPCDMHSCILQLSWNKVAWQNYRCDIVLTDVCLPLSCHSWFCFLNFKLLLFLKFLSWNIRNGFM